MSSADLQTVRRDRVIGLATALLIGVNLRPAITSVAALLEQTAQWLSLSPAEVSLLATLPVIAFGATAPLGPVLARRIGVSRTLAWTMAVLAVALVARVAVPAAMLVGTFVIGAAIMAASTLLPQHLKALGVGGTWIGLSSMSFSLGAALGAGLSVPLSAVTGGPAAALGVWAVPALLALGAAVVMSRGSAPASGARRGMLITRRTFPTVALVTGVFGLQAMLFFALASWLPRILADSGADQSAAGWYLALANVAGLVPTLLAPMIARHRRALAWFGPGLGILLVVPFVLLMTGAPAHLPIVILLGATQGALFGLSLSLIVTQSENEATAGLLSATAQGVGYAFAGVLNFVLGLLRDATGSWTVSLTVMIAAAIALSIVIASTIRHRPVDLLAPAEPAPQE